MATEAPAPAFADETFPERLKRWRTRLHLNQAEFAEAIGVLRFTVHRWETNKQPPTIAQLTRIATLTEQSVDYWAEPFVRYEEDELEP